MAELPQNISNYLNTQALLEDGALPPGTQGDGKAFVQYVTANKSMILTNFSTIAQNPKQQELLLAAFEFLGGNDYIDVLNKVCDLKQSGAISDNVFISAFEGLTSAKYGFLLYNYQNAQVIALINRAQRLAPNSDFQMFCKGILDGSRKTIDAAYLAQDNSPTPEVLSP